MASLSGLAIPPHRGDVPASGAEAPPPNCVLDRTRPGGTVLGLPPNLVLGMLCVAGFCCCVPMALPQSHLVAFCTDVGIPAAQGAAMLSVLQACAFFSRQFWGWLADRVGGLPTLLAGSACQALAIARVPADPERGRAVRRVGIQVDQH